MSDHEKNSADLLRFQMSCSLRPDHSHHHKTNWIPYSPEHYKRFLCDLLLGIPAVIGPTITGASNGRGCRQHLLANIAGIDGDCGARGAGGYGNVSRVPGCRGSCR